MKTITKKASAISKATAPATLPADLAALFANASDADARELKAAASALDRDPAFAADYLKGLVVEDILRALEETGTSKNELAKRIGKSRQYVSNVLNESSRVNFTIDTLAQFAVALDRKLCVRILPPTQQMHVMRTAPITISPGLIFDSLTANNLDFGFGEEVFQAIVRHDFCRETVAQTNYEYTNAA